MIPHPLTWIILLPLLGMLCLLFVPANQTTLLRRIAVTSLLLPFLLSLWVFACYDRYTAGFQFVEYIPWISSLGISYHLGVDGINSLLVLLVGLGSFAAVLSSAVQQRLKEYYLLILATVVGTYGAFLSLDIFFFYFLHEIATIPTFLLIAIWGSKQREYAAMKMTLYLTAGASLALVGLIALYCSTGINSFDFVSIQEALTHHPLPIAVQYWIFPLIVLGFGITLTLWPFHTWAPVGYAEAPTAVSMLHAGVIKKLGAYAILRFAICLMPQAAHSWMPFVAGLAIVNILFCGLVALAQKDMKYILGYSSCSHMGYVFLGLACLNSIGLNGVVFLMFAHGVMAALAFALTGYFSEQTNTRNLDELGGLGKKMPFIATCFIMAALASAGVPGFANFVSEIMVLIGAFDQYPWLTVLAILGIVVTAIYMLKAIRFGFQGPMNDRLSQQPLADAQGLLARLPMIILLAALLLTGCFPSMVIKNIDSATKLIAQRLTN